jgi:phosphoglucomutase
MSIHPRAGEPAPHRDRLNVPRTLVAYYRERPDPRVPAQRVAFGTSGHRGSARSGSFNEPHLLAVCQALAEQRKEEGVDGPLYLGMDTHALSEAALATALEVFAAHALRVVIDPGMRPLPTPVISHAILRHNATGGRRADGVIITPSHNPPEDGGIKYNPPSGGPADASTTRAIEGRANAILENGLREVRRVPLAEALRAPTTERRDVIDPYVDDLAGAIDLDAIRSEGVRLGVDPLGGSSLAVWERIAERHRLPLEIVRPEVDPSFAFMPLDHDGKVRMDCSSPYAMAGLIELRERFDVAVGNDPDADRHGIVTGAGLMNPNHFLAVCVDYLFRHRDEWGSGVGVGKTLVSSSMIDRVAASLGRRLVEVPVGFKWFVEGLLDGSIGFCGEESAGATFLRADGGVWTTDKDGILLGLLAAEITARTGRDPGTYHADLAARFGASVYERVDAPASTQQKAALQALSPESVAADSLAGEPIRDTLTRAPGNGAPIGGLKVVTENGWFAARPSGTEEVYKIYAESFLGEDHLRRIQREAREIVDQAFAAVGVGGEARGK